MKQYKLLERIGLGVFILGGLFMFADIGALLNQDIFISKEYLPLMMVGVTLWGLGYFKGKSMDEERY
jgi:hypothetical protein